VPNNGSLFHADVLEQRVLDNVKILNNMAGIF